MREKYILTDTPSFSILIATYNRPRQLRNCLEHITQLDYPREHFEVIVVDDGSEQPLDDVIAAFADRLDCRLVVQENAGVSAARNMGAVYARKTFLAILDDDCIPLPDWLTQLATQLQQTPRALIGGKTLNALPDNVYSEASHAILVVLYEHYNRDPQQAHFFTSMNTAMRRNLFIEIGGYDDIHFPYAGEDRDLIDRWRLNGLPAIYVPQAQVLHAHDLDLRGYWRQHCNYSRVAHTFHEVHHARANQQVSFEPMFHFRVWTYALRSDIKQPLWWRLCLQMLLYLEQGINVYGYARARFADSLPRILQRQQ
jgi:GT2 family glycosyltransferase